MRHISSFERVDNTPQTYLPNAIYFSQSGNRAFNIHLSNATGTAITSIENSTITNSAINDLLSTLMNKSIYDPNLDRKIDISIISGLSNLATSDDYSLLLNKPILGTLASTNEFNHANEAIQLSESGIIPSISLLGYSDEVQEFTSFSEFPITGNTNVIYIDSTDSKRYRWKNGMYNKMDKDIVDTDSLIEGSVNLYYSDSKMVLASPVKSILGYTGVVSVDNLKSGLGLGNVAYKNAGIDNTTVAIGNHTHTVSSITMSLGVLGNNTSGNATTLSLGTNLAFSGSKLILTPLESAIYDYGLINHTSNVTVTLDLNKAPVQKLTVAAYVAGMNGYIALDLLASSVVGNKTVTLYIKIPRNPTYYYGAGPLVHQYGYDSLTGGGCVVYFTNNLLYTKSNIILQEPGLIPPFASDLGYGADQTAYRDYIMKLVFHCVNGNVWITSSCYKSW